MDSRAYVVTAYDADGNELGQADRASELLERFGQRMTAYRVAALGDEDNPRWQRRTRVEWPADGGLPVSVVDGALWVAG